MLPVALALAATTSGCLNDGVDREQYTARNVRILNSVPLYPGARLVSADTIEDRDFGMFGDGSGPAGDATPGGAGLLRPRSSGRGGQG
jgi:hypothetical protein